MTTSWIYMIGSGLEYRADLRTRAEYALIRAYEESARFAAWMDSIFELVGDTRIFQVKEDEFQRWHDWEDLPAEDIAKRIQRDCTAVAITCETAPIARKRRLKETTDHILPAPVEVEPVERPDWSGYGIEALRKIAAANGIKGSARLRKAAAIIALEMIAEPVIPA